VKHTVKLIKHIAISFAPEPVKEIVIAKKRGSDFDRLAKVKTVWPPKLYEYPKNSGKC
jgi:hypothetical protein